MPTFDQIDDHFICPYRHGCPYLEGLSTHWVWMRYQETALLECQYEHQLEQLTQQLRDAGKANEQLEQQNQQLQAQLHALHRSQFKGRTPPIASTPDSPLPPGKKKRGAPKGHPPWLRKKPKRIDQILTVPAPTSCPHGHKSKLQPLTAVHEHLQEDIVLEPRTVVTSYQHHQAYCPNCDRNVWQLGPGELPGAYIGPVAKATATYLRYELNVSYRKISRFFNDFFGLQFVPASAYGFDCQATRRGVPLYEDLRQKIRALPVAHGDETSWRHDGQGHWLWYAGDDQVAFFQIDPHRSGQTAQSIFGEHFAGILISDAYGAYDAVESKDWQSCLAHLKRKAKELDQELVLLKGKAADPPARRFCAKVQELIGRACQAHRKLHQARWRPKAARAKERALRRQLAGLGRKPLRYPPAEHFRKRLMGSEQKHMFTFLRHKNVPPTNNQAERSLRPLVIMRKVLQCTRGPKGLENQSVLHSLQETVRRQGKKPHQFFLDLFHLNTVQAQAALYRKAPNAKRGKPPRPMRC
jgi:hypothetical protein